MENSASSSALDGELFQDISLKQDLEESNCLQIAQLQLRIKRKKKNASRIFIAIQKFPKPNKIHNLAFNQISKQAKKQESMIHYKNYQSNEMNPKLIQMIESIDKDMKTVIQYIQKI